MTCNIKKITHPDHLNNEWDNLAECYYLKREFLSHLQTHNFCNQVYYELYHEDKFVLGTIAYTVKTNLLTFINVPTPVAFRVIGLPVSIASLPFVGDWHFLDFLLEEMIKQEEGLILGLNFNHAHVTHKVVNMRTLPTMVLPIKVKSIEEYKTSLRHPYRRRFKRISDQFSDIVSETTSCNEFNARHYELYLAVMKTTTTKLEILKADAFKYLPEKFRLTTFYAGGEMLFWHILLPDEKRIYYYMCGINYRIRDQYKAYNNSLFAIVESAIKMKYQLLDLGQTAEVAKSRVGAVPEERLMFMYHKNPVFNLLLKLFKNFITYSAKPPVAMVFKSEPSLNKKVYEDIIHPS